MIKTLIENFQKKLSLAKESIEKFKVAVNQEWNIAHTLEWSQPAFKAAAQAEVFAYILQSLLKASSDTPDESKYIHNFHTFIEHKLLSAATDPKFSTSVTSNLLDSYRTSAWAEALEVIKETRF